MQSVNKHWFNCVGIEAGMTDVGPTKEIGKLPKNQVFTVLFSIK